MIASARSLLILFCNQGVDKRCNDILARHQHDSVYNMWNGYQGDSMFDVAIICEMDIVYYICNCGYVANICHENVVLIISIATVINCIIEHRNILLIQFIYT